MEVLVKPWNNYQLYYRDPDSRQFKPLENLDGSKWSVYFRSEGSKPEPVSLVKWIMRPKTGDRYERQFSRKKDLQYIQLEK